MHSAKLFYIYKLSDLSVQFQLPVYIHVVESIQRIYTKNLEERCKANK